MFECQTVGVYSGRLICEIKRRQVLCRRRALGTRPERTREKRVLQVDVLQEWRIIRTRIGAIVSCKHTCSGNPEATANGGCTASDRIPREANSRKEEELILVGKVLRNTILAVEYQTVQRIVVWRERQYAVCIYDGRF